MYFLSRDKLFKAFERRLRKNDASFAMLLDSPAFFKSGKKHTVSYLVSDSNQVKLFENIDIQVKKNGRLFG